MHADAKRDQSPSPACGGGVGEGASTFYIELHARSAFSFLRAGSGVEALVARAAALGMSALALTDYMTLAGIVRFQKACASAGIRAIAGAELAIADPTFGDAAAPAVLVALARDAQGYANLCALLTEANLNTPDHPIIPYTSLIAHHAGLTILTGGRDGALARLLLAERTQAAEDIAARYARDFGQQVCVEIQHHALPDDALLAQRLAALAQRVGLRTILTNGVCHATRADYPLYDLLTCVRLGISVDQPHRARPANSEAHLKSGSDLTPLLAGHAWATEAMATSTRIAADCATISLVREVCRAPQVAIPADATPASHLRTLCEEGLAARYAHTPAARMPDSPQRAQMEHELAVITRLELAEFFLCVAEIMREARSMGIRCGGRGSAANSIVAYLLGITGVDPLAHGLLFERFLNPDRRGMPDIDVDVASDRREELIRYVERRYTHEHAAMVANVITYRARSALRDVAKGLGYPLPLINKLTKLLSHHTSRDELARAQRDAATLIAAWADWPGDAATRATAQRRARDRLPLLFALAPRLLGLPRHLSLHNGGIVLTREPLARTLAVRISANGVRALEIDKDDIEACGLIKFDLLGLRTLGAIEECLTLIEETTGQRPPLDALPMNPPDERTMRLIRAGATLAVFQIESPGQWHLLAQTQPRTFDDLIIQTALFRPGPLQGGFVNPYVLRRQAHLDESVPVGFTAERHTATTSAATSATCGNLGARPPLSREAEEGSGEGACLPNPRAKCSMTDVHAPSASPPPAGGGVGGGATHGGGRRGPQRDAVQTPWQGARADDFWTAHPVLGPLLADTQGILLFQEQILSIAHAYAGLSYAEADGFRRAMSHARRPEEMEAMHARFLDGATAHGECVADAERVFSAIAAYVGYGFCKSHAAEFARTIYLSAWLKAHYPAHYLAAFLSSQPAGFFPPHVILEEAKLLGIPALAVEINRSAARFSVERVGTREAPSFVAHPSSHWNASGSPSPRRERGLGGEAIPASRPLPFRGGGRGRGPSAPNDASSFEGGREVRPPTYAIRIGLGQVRAVGDEFARAILWERDGAHGEPRPFRSLADFCRRMRPAGLSWEAAESLVLVGAFTLVHPKLDRRRLLWHLHELWPLVSARRQPTSTHRRHKGASTTEAEDIAQLALEWVVPETPPDDLLPALPTFDREEGIALDYALLGMSARPHPLALLRRQLRRQGVQSIAELGESDAGRLVRVAGWTISAQRPPTAKGMGFLVLEDETGRLPVAVPPLLAARLYALVRSARVLCVTGRVERIRWYRSLLVRDLRPIS